MLGAEVSPALFRGRSGRPRSTIGIFGEVGATAAMLAGLSGDARVLDSLMNGGVPLLGGGAATVVVIAWRPPPIRGSSMLVATIVAVALAPLGPA